MSISLVNSLIVSFTLSSRTGSDSKLGMLFALHRQYLLQPKNTRASSTQEWDLICNDYELDGPNQTVHGRKWKDCLTCESTSTATDSNARENDVYWFLCAYQRRLRRMGINKPDLAS